MTNDTFSFSNMVKTIFIWWLTAEYHIFCVYETHLVRRETCYPCCDTLIPYHNICRVFHTETHLSMSKTTYTHTHTTRNACHTIHTAHTHTHTHGNLWTFSNPPSNITACLCHNLSYNYLHKGLKTSVAGLWYIFVLNICHYPTHKNILCTKK